MEGFSKVGHASQAAFDLGRIRCVPLPDPLFELIQPCFFAVNQLPPLIWVLGVERSDKAAVGVNGPSQLQLPSDRGK